tara:strand:- start:1754 stop:4141 length:2388 start_codon:yes stop_codon:yes gene_type:complete
MSNKLLHSKLSKKRILSHLPSKTDGHDGDIQIVSIKSKGTFLCVKNNGDWKISDKFSDRNRFDTHEFDKIKAPKIYGRSGLNISLDSQTVVTASPNDGNETTIIQPILSVGNGTSQGVVISNNDKTLLLKGGKTASYIRLLNGANSDILFGLNGTAGLTAHCSRTTTNNLLDLRNTANSGTAHSSMSITTRSTDGDAYINLGFIPDESSSAQWAMGMDSSDTDSFKVIYKAISGSGASPAQLTISEGSPTASFKIDTSGNTTTSGTATAGGFTTTGTWTFDTSAGGTTGITQINVGTAFTDNDTTLMSAGAIKEKIEDYGYSTATGDITGVDLTGGTGISIDSETNTTSGAYSSTITCNLEGTELISTGEGGGSKYLREDGDGTCSWQTVSTPTNYITNDAADIMAVSDFGANAALKIDADQPATAGAEDSKGLWIDYDRIVAGSGTANHHDIGIDLDVNTASLGTSSVKGIDIDVVGATSGTHIAYGMTVNVSGSDSNLGILSNVTNGGIDLQCLSSANIGDYFMLQTLANGETTLTTVDADASLAHINLIADGEIRLNAKDFGPTDGIQFLADGTKFADFTAHHNYSELRLYENQGASTNDFVSIQSHANGAGILQTNDVAGTAAHLSLEPDGDLIFDSNTQNIYTKDASNVLNPIVKTHTVSFTEAQVNNFHSAPQILLAAQGANKVIIPTSIMLFITRDGSTAQSNSSCDLTIGYDGAVSSGHISYYVRRFMYNESGSRMIRVYSGFGNDVGQSLTEGDDADLTIAVDSAVTSGSIDAIKAVFSYYVFDNS